MLVPQVKEVSQHMSSLFYQLYLIFYYKNLLYEKRYVIKSFLKYISYSKRITKLFRIFLLYYLYLEYYYIIYHRNYIFILLFTKFTFWEEIFIILFIRNYEQKSRKPNSLQNKDMLLLYILFTNIFFILIILCLAISHYLSHLAHHLLILLVKSHLQLYPCPLQINYLWNLGFLLGISIIIQIITGIFSRLNRLLRECVIWIFLYCIYQ